MLELGANWAYYSMLFAATIASSSHLAVHSVMLEPSSFSIACAKRNWAANGLCPPSTSSIRAQWLKALICAPPSEYHDISIQSTADDCTTVSRIQEDLSLKHIDVFFADIQGAEMQALRIANLSAISHVWLGTHSAQVHNDSRSLLVRAGFFIEYEKINIIAGKWAGDGYIHVSSRCQIGI